MQDSTIGAFQVLGIIVLLIGSFAVGRMSGELHGKAECEPAIKQLEFKCQKLEDSLDRIANPRPTQIPEPSLATPKELKI